MPIKMNPTGKYNLNFIDWQNEFDAVHERYDQGSGESPIYGMDIETFEAIVNEEELHDQRDKFGVKRKFYERFPIKKATDSSTDK